MGRRPGTAKICVICGDKAKGINFNAATCMSCKAFFRRNGLTNKNLTCPFESKCKIDILTRRFCTKCRLEKCFKSGMKKEWILSEDARARIKEKIRLNRLKRLEDEAKEDCSDGARHEETSSGTVSSSTDVTQFFQAGIQSSQASSSTSSEPDLLSTLMPGIFGPEMGSQSIEDLLLASPTSVTSNFEGDLLRDLDIFGYAPSPPSGLALEQRALALYTEPSSRYSAILDFTPTQLTPGSSLSSLSLAPTPDADPFPYSELILPESTLLSELTRACTVLVNPYRRIQYVESLPLPEASRLSEYTFHRLIRMAKQLSAFTSLSREGQGALLKGSLLQMLSIRTVTMFNPSREAWSFIHDSAQSSVLVPMKYLEPYCTRHAYARHRALPTLFRDEWKQDSVIFDLLTAIVLFTPKPEYGEENERISAEHRRYQALLYRYLRLKYPTAEEADGTYRQLLANIEEMFAINGDIVTFLRCFDTSKESPFFVQLLDLQGTTEAREGSRCALEESSISEIGVIEATPTEESRSEHTEEFLLENLLWL